MRVRKLDKNDDMTFGGGGNDYHRDTPDGVAQCIKTRLRLWRGEFFAATADGTPWLTHVTGERTKQVYDAVIRSRIQRTQGAMGLPSYSSELDPVTRVLRVSAEANTQYGKTKYLGEINV